MSSLRKTEWPAWWDWELELRSHILKRMVDRDFSEFDLRNMMSIAMNLREDHESVGAGS